MRLSDLLLAGGLAANLYIYTLARRPAATVHWLLVAVGLYVLTGLWRSARGMRAWEFGEFGPGPWNNE